MTIRSNQMPIYLLLTECVSTKGISSVYTLRCSAETKGIKLISVMAGTILNALQPAEIVHVLVQSWEDYKMAK